MKKVPNIPEVFKEIDGSGIPTVFFKVTSKGSYAVFPLEAALKLMRAYEPYEESSMLLGGKEGIKRLPGNPQTT